MDKIKLVAFYIALCEKLAIEFEGNPFRHTVQELRKLVRELRMRAGNAAEIREAALRQGSKPLLQAMLYLPPQQGIDPLHFFGANR
jgi:hypothetical protein